MNLKMIKHITFFLLEWVDDPTRAAAIKKAKAITDMIGYPEYIMQKSGKDLNNKYKDLKVEEDAYYNNTIHRNEFSLKVRPGKLANIFIYCLSEYN